MWSERPNLSKPPVQLHDFQSVFLSFYQAAIGRIGPEESLQSPFEGIKIIKFDPIFEHWIGVSQFIPLICSSSVIKTKKQQILQRIHECWDWLEIYEYWFTNCLQPRPKKMYIFYLRRLHKVKIKLCPGRRKAERNCHWELVRAPHHEPRRWVEF